MKVCLMLGLLVPLAIEDIRTRKLNLLWMLIIGGVGTVYRLLFLRVTVVEFLCALAVGAGLLVLAVNSDAVGSGDGVMFLAVGTICGFWESLSLLGESMMLCFLTGIVLRFFLRKAKTVRMPVAPFVLTAYLADLLLPALIEKMGMW